jgi:uncharacterized delta-60 repeat protein/LPXTG-motif cell wall-anchored protein
VFLACGLPASLASAADGTLDTTLDMDGKVTTDMGAASDDIVSSVAMQSDGKFLVAGYSDKDGSYDFAVVRYNTDGSLDTTFDTDGKVTTDIGILSYETPRSVVLQLDGKIVVGGRSKAGGSYDFAVVRYNTDGSLDATFDFDGKVTTDFGIMSNDQANSVVLQSDGKILVTGFSKVGGTSDIAVVRYNVNGSLDTTFDGDGKVITDVGTGTDDGAEYVVLQSDGKILVAGYSNVGGTTDFAVVRYNVNGSLDATFDNDGKVVTDMGAASDDIVSSVAMQSDGKILVAGYSDKGGSYDFAVVRYNTDGSLDATFDNDGKVVTDIGNNSADFALSAVLQPDGKIVVGGQFGASGLSDFALVRYNNDGSLDTTFDNDGKTITDIGTNSNDQGLWVVLQSDGKIVSAGYSDAGGSNDFVVVRYNAMSLSATLTSSSTNASSASITFNVTGTEAIDCTTLSTTSGVDFNLTGISAITSVTQTSPTICTIGATSRAVADGVAVTSTLAVTSSFSLGFANSNTRTTLSGSSQSVVVTIAAVVTSVSPTTTIAASTTTTIAPTTTAEAVVIASVRKLIATKGELPKTGSDSSPLLVLGTMFLVAGVLVSTRKRVAKR